MSQDEERRFIPVRRSLRVAGMTPVRPVNSYIFANYPPPSSEGNSRPSTPTRHRNQQYQAAESMPKYFNLLPSDLGSSDFYGDTPTARLARARKGNSIARESNSDDAHLGSYYIGIPESNINHTHSRPRNGHFHAIDSVNIDDEDSVRHPSNITDSVTDIPNRNQEIQMQSQRTIARRKGIVRKDMLPNPLATVKSKQSGVSRSIFISDPPQPRSMWISMFVRKIILYLGLTVAVLFFSLFLAFYFTMDPQLDGVHTDTLRKSQELIDNNQSMPWPEEGGSQMDNEKKDISSPESNDSRESKVYPASKSPIISELDLKVVNGNFQLIKEKILKLEEAVWLLRSKDSDSRTNLEINRLEIALNESLDSLKTEISRMDEKRNQIDVDSLRALVDEKLLMRISASGEVTMDVRAVQYLRRLISKNSRNTVVDAKERINEASLNDDIVQEKIDSATQSIKSHLSESGRTQVEALKSELQVQIDLLKKSIITEKRVEDIVDSRTSMLSAPASSVKDEERTIPRHISYVDYALWTMGSRVIWRKTSPTYQQPNIPWFLRLLGMGRGRSPKVALTPDNTPGNCWSFPGNHGSLAIALGTSVIPTHLALEHADPLIGLDRSSAPKAFRVWTSLPKSSEILLGTYEYSIDILEEGQNIVQQTFELERLVKTPVSNIRIEILSNHGRPDYTCLYRVRLHSVV